MENGVLNNIMGDSDYSENQVYSSESSNEDSERIVLTDNSEEVSEHSSTKSMKVKCLEENSSFICPNRLTTSPHLRRGTSQPRSNKLASMRSKLSWLKIDISKVNSNMVNKDQNDTDTDIMVSPHPGQLKAYCQVPPKNLSTLKEVIS